MDTTATLPIDEEWPFILSLLPADLEQSARDFAALRRKRGVPDAAALLRLAFAYAIDDKSLRDTATWAKQQDVAQLSNVALLKRLRNATPWLGHLLALKLAQRLDQAPDWPVQRRIRLIDASGVSRPASKGTDWRIHLSFDLAKFAIDDIQLTKAGGESLTRFQFQAGDLALSDRGYAQRQGIYHVYAAQAAVLTRLNLQNVPLQTAAGTPFAVLPQLRGLKIGQIGEWVVQTAPDEAQAIPAVPGRLVVRRKSAKATKREQQRIVARAHKEGRQVKRETLEAAKYIMLFTTLRREELAAAQVLALYRMRWQIELVFKRLKSLLDLDELAARSDSLGASYLQAKLLLSLVVEDMSRLYRDFSPCAGRAAPTVEYVAVVQGDAADIAANRERGTAAGGVVGQSADSGTDVS